jgi:hypothetical protein
MKAMCDCKEWMEGIGQINTAMAMSFAYGTSYRGEQFRFCPWCGKPLITDEERDGSHDPQGA